MTHLYKNKNFIALSVNLVHRVHPGVTAPLLLRKPIANPIIFQCHERVEEISQFSVCKTSLKLKRYYVANLISTFAATAV